MNEVATPDREFSLPPELERLVEQVETAAAQLFAGTELQSQLRSITRNAASDCRRLIEWGSAPTPSLVVLGTLGEGKSWLARCLLTSHPDNQVVRHELRSGQNHDDRTSRLTWFGPQRPPSLQEPGERFVLVPESHLLDLGRPYIVGDTPGYSDIDAFRRVLSGVASTSATIKILVCSFSQVRDGGLAEFVAQLDGSIILPVIRFRPDANGASLPPESTRLDVEQELAGWRRQAPHAQLLAPCYMPDKDVFGETEGIELMQRRLQAALAPALAALDQLRDAVDRQLEQRIGVARREIAAVLSPFHDRVRGPVEHLERLTSHLPERLVAALIGEELDLRAALRPRFRADWIERTPALCFPFRTLLGLLALTAGAWDRLIFSLAGSAPSLVLTFFQAARNVRDLAKSSRQLLDGLNQRIERLLQDEFRPAIRTFHAAVAASLPAAEERLASADSTDGEVVRVIGLDGVEAESRRIFLAAVQSERARSTTVRSLALLATGIFAFLAAGPLVALYRAYCGAHFQAFGAQNAPLADFPTPSAAMLLSSFVLSVLPVFVLALIAMAWSCRPSRVERAMEAVRDQHRQSIRERFATGALRIELTDSHLDAARRLLALSAR